LTWEGGEVRSLEPPWEIMTLLEEMSAKLLKLRGPGKDIAAALHPIFAAMDTKKTGELGPVEFKTCLLALGIRSSNDSVLRLFGEFGGRHFREGGRVAYTPFLRSVVETLPPLPGAAQPQANSPRKGTFVSALVSKRGMPLQPTEISLAPPPPPTPPRESVPMASFFPSSEFGGFRPISEEVSHFNKEEDKQIREKEIKRC